MALISDMLAARCLVISAKQDTNTAAGGNASPPTSPAQCCLVCSCIHHGACGQHADVAAPRLAVVLKRAVQVLEGVSRGVTRQDGADAYHLLHQECADWVR